MKKFKFPRITFIEKLRRKFKIKKKKKKLPDDIVYSPAHDLSPLGRIIGIMLRAVILFLGVFGIVLFFCDAFEFTVAGNSRLFRITGGYVALCSAIWALCAGASSYNSTTAKIVPPLSAAAYLGVTAIMYGNPFSFIYYSVLRIINYACYTMVLRGYTYFGNFMIGDGYDYSGARFTFSDPYRSGGILILAAVITILLSLAMMKKVRLWLLVPITAVCTVPLLVYNMTTEKLGFAFIIAFAAACVSLYVYDYRFAGGYEKRQERIIKRHNKKEAKRAERARRREEKEKLREEADKMLVAALSADMGAKKSKMAKKAVYKADKLSKKRAAKQAKKQKKAEKKQAKLKRTEAKKELAKLKKNAKGGNAEASSRLASLASDKKAAKAEKKALRAEKKAARKAERNRKYLVSAAGGFAGIGAAVAAFIAVLLPVLIMTKAFPEIGPIYEQISKANAYVSAYLSGSEVDLNDPDVYGPNKLAPRTLTFEPLEFEEVSMFLVNSTSPQNIYLKSWSADTYDHATSTWNSATVEEVVSYRDRFGIGFSPDSIGTNFKNLVYPSTAYITESEVYENLAQYGFTMQSVIVQHLSGTSRLLFIPTQLNTNYNLLEAGTLDATEREYQSYYDGIYSTRFFGRGYTYSTISFVPTMSRSSVNDEFENAIRYFEASAQFVQSTDGLVPEQVDEFLYEYEMLLEENGITYLGTSIGDRYFNSMTDAEREQFKENYKAELEYRSYVNDLFTQTTGSERITELAAEILKNAEAKYGEPTEHELVMSVIDWLDDNLEYTLTPDATLQSEEENVLEAFLFEVKEGYCSHFATAATQLLREMDVPTRYCEGYIADEMLKGFDGYTTEVLDSNAHAWIEIYRDNMGWVMYEVTPPYLDGMYVADNATKVEEDNEDNESSSAMPEDDDDDDPTAPDDGDLAGADEEIGELELFIRVLIGVAIFLVLVFIIRFAVKRFIRRGTNMLFERYRLIERAKDEAVYKDPKTDRRKLARSIDDQIIEIFECIGQGPESGELSSEYGKRLNASFGSNLSKISAEEVFRIIQKEEFGDGITYEEMCTIAEYLADITVTVYAGLSPLQKLRFRYLKRKI